MGFGSMFVGVTGLNAQGVSMDVIGNNLANVSTIGYKFAKTQFSDAMNVAVATGSHQPDTGGTAGVYNQIGKGVMVASTYADFRQGGLETTNESTDLAINGKGFFKVRDTDSGEFFYTRAGNFRFTSDGYLVGPGNYVLQGGAVDQTTGKASGSGDIKLPLEEVIFDEGTAAQRTQLTVVCDPKATTTMNVSMNLDSSATSQASNASNPFFSLLSSWNGRSSKPLSLYSGSQSMKVYDADGQSHTLTMYLDPVAASNAGGLRYWEYVVAMNPSEDGRAGIQGTSGAGLLMAGTMTFSASGDLLNQSAYTLSPDADDPKDLSNWIPSQLSAGLPVFEASFGTSGASSTSQTIGMGFGLSNAGTWTTASGSAGSVGRNALALTAMTSPSVVPPGTTNYATGTALLSLSQDGYAQGYMTNIAVDQYGYVVAAFTNGEEKNLFQVNLSGFTNPYGLRREGGNLFRAGKDSGQAFEGVPQDEGASKDFGFGAIQSKSLESSNVDMADQFVQMILTQRGFQANTKVITTSDTILGRLIDLKR